MDGATRLGVRRGNGTERVGFTRNPWNLAAAAALLIFYLWLLAALPLDVFWHPDAGAKLMAVESIHWSGGLRYDLPDPGHAIDRAGWFSLGHCKPIYPRRTGRGKIEFRWPIWFALLSTVPYRAFGIVGLYIVPLLSGWLVAVIAGLLADRQSPALAAPAILMVGVASPVAFYSLCFSEHTLATLLATAATAVVCLWRPGKLTSLLAALPLLLLATALRPEIAAFDVALVGGWGLAALRARTSQGAPHQRPARRTILYWAAILGGSAILAWILFVSMPARYTDEYMPVLRNLGVASRAKLLHLPALLIGVFVQAHSGPPVPSAGEWAMLAALLGAAVIPFIPVARLEMALGLAALLVVFQYGAITAISTPPYIGGQGIAVIAPYIAIAGYALAGAWRRREVPAVALAASAALYLLTGFALFFVFRSSVIGEFVVGLDGGARYVLTLFPLAAVAALLAIHSYRLSERPPLARSAFTVLVASMILVAAQYQLRGLRGLDDNRALISRWESAIAASGTPVVTDVWWLAAAVAPLAMREPFFCVNDRTRVSRWLELARKAGVREFTFASREPLLSTAALGPHAAELDAEETRFVEGMYLVRLRIK